MKKIFLVAFLLCSVMTFAQYRWEVSGGPTFSTLNLDGADTSSGTGFYFNANTAEFKEMPAYFEGSATAITDINNNGFVVGQGVTEKSGSNRRREAFLYEIGAIYCLLVLYLVVHPDPSSSPNLT